MPRIVNVVDDSMQKMSYLLRKPHLGAVEAAYLGYEGFIQGSLFARICVEGAALKACHLCG